MRSLLFLFVLLVSTQIAAQERVDRYMRHAHPLGSIDLSFPGPGGGYTFANLELQKINEDGDTNYKKYPFLVDFTSSSDGTFIPPDSMRSVIKDHLEHVIRLSDVRFVRANLSPSHTKAEFKELDTNFAGVLGYYFFRKFVTVFDFKRNKLTLYPLYANVDIGERDTNAVQVEYKDDAIISYCKCPSPGVWLEAEAPPIKNGRVFFGFGTPVSEVYKPSLDKATLDLFEKNIEEDSLTGKKSIPGFSLATFKIGKSNIANRNPKRIVKDLPALFKDLNISVMGSMGTDVLRRFSAMIFDPSRGKVILVK